MRQINMGTPQQVTTYGKQYTQFRGVDFSTDSTQVSEVRSPAAQNIVSDMSGFPEKRLGWRYLHKMNATIHAMFYAVFANGDKHLFVHAGTALYTWDESDAAPVQAVTGLADAESTHFVHAGILYLLDGTTYWSVRKTDAGLFEKKAVAEDDPYIPTVRISITGNAVTALDDKGTQTIGGHTYVEHEEPNYLTAHRKCTMVGDGVSTIFRLPEKPVSTVVKVTVEGTVKPDGYTLDTEKGEITFAEAPAAAEAGAGLANIEIEYTVESEKNAACINRCTIADTFGYFNDNRFFLSGDPTQEYWNVDYMSGTDDPTYFPYDGYVRIGADTSRIMGYLKQYDSQLIIKEDNDQDAQIYVRTASYDDENGTLFPVQQGVRGVGAVAKRAMGVLRDDPLFLAEEGVFAITSSSVKEHRSVQDRSFFVNAKLQNEPNMDKAVAATWNGYFVLCLNDHCYVADARQQTAMSSTEEYGYEWYYWTNIPAKVMLSHDGSLYFGSNDNGICKFNSDIARMTKYADGAFPTIPTSQMTEEEQETFDAITDAEEKQHYRESLRPGVAIEAVWATRSETFGTITNTKNIAKKGCAIMIKPYTRSSVEIAYLTEREGNTEIRKAIADILDFSDIDFSRITFNTLDMPMVIPINRKIKKFNILQIFLTNREINEGFGVYSIQVTYTLGGYVK